MVVSSWKDLIPKYPVLKWLFIIVNHCTSNCKFNVKSCNKLPVLRYPLTLQRLKKYLQILLEFLLTLCSGYQMFWFWTSFPKYNSKKYSIRAFTEQCITITFYKVKQNNYPFPIPRQPPYFPFFKLCLFMYLIQCTLLCLS